jgi:hypothetical protein
MGWILNIRPYLALSNATRLFHDELLKRLDS